MLDDYDIRARNTLAQRLLTELKSLGLVDDRTETNLLYPSWESIIEAERAMGLIMTEVEFDRRYENGDLDDQYAEYIMANCGGERIIGNGDALVVAMEEFYLFDAFKDDVLSGRITINA